MQIKDKLNLIDFKVIWDNVTNFEDFKKLFSHSDMFIKLDMGTVEGIGYYNYLKSKNIIVKNNDK